MSIQIQPRGRLRHAYANSDSYLDYMNPPVPEYRLPWGVHLDPETIIVGAVSAWCRENFGERWIAWSQPTVAHWVFLTQAQAVQFVLRWHGALL